MLPDITNYIPDPNNGRPIANGQVYFFIDGYTPPTNINDVDPDYVAEVTAGGAVLPQPIYTTQGGVLRTGSLANMPQVSVSTLVKRVAVYDKCGALIYSTAYNGIGAFVDVDALAAADSDVLVGGVTAGDLGRKFKQEVYVTDFGAKCDGVTNDTLAVNAAIAYINSLPYKPELVFPAGKCLCNISDTSLRSLYIRGAGSQLTEITSYLFNSFAISVDNNFRHFSLSGVKVSGSDMTSHGVYLNIGSNAVFNDVDINSCGVGVLSNSTINVSYNKTIFQRNYCGILLTTRITGDLVIGDINGQSFNVTTAFFSSHPTCHYLNECLITLNTIGFYVEQGGNPFQDDNFTSIRNTVVEANKLGVFYNQPNVLGLAQNHVPSNDMVWFESNKSDDPISINGLVIPANKCGDVYQVGGGSIWRNCSIDKWYSEDNAISHWDMCMAASELATFTTEDTSSIIANELHGENSNFLSANIITDSLVTDTNRVTAAKCGTLTNFCRKENTLFSTKSFTSSPDYGYGSTVTNAVDGVFETAECKEYSATSGNGAIVSSGAAEIGKYYLNVFSAKLVSGESLFSYLNLGGGGAFGTTKPFNLSATWQTFAFVSRPNSVGSGDTSNIIAPPAGSSVFRVSGAFTIKFNNAAELVSFMKKGLFPV